MFMGTSSNIKLHARSVLTGISGNKVELSVNISAMQYGICSKVKQSSNTLPLTSDFCCWVEVWTSYKGKEILTLLLIWIKCVAISLCILMAYWCTFCAEGDGEIQSMPGLVPAEVLSRGYCPNCRWTSSRKKCRNKLRVDERGKSDCLNKEERLLGSISIIYKPS